MAYASYERQILATYAAGYISGDGNTRIAFGCEMTRVGTGVYALVLGSDAGLVNDETFTFVTTKQALGSSGLPSCAVTVEDTSNLVKTIYVTSVGSSPTVINRDIEVEIRRSVTRSS